MSTQEVLLSVLAILTGAIALINTIIKEGSFIRSSNRKDSAAVEIADQIKYFSNDSRDNCRNSLIFKSMTGRRAPIRLINLILNCYDPHLATYIYSKAPRYIFFRRDSIENWELEEPGIVRSRLLRLMLSLMIVSALALLILSLYALGALLISAATAASFMTAVLFYGVSVVVLVLLVVFAIALLRYAYKEIAFLDLVKTFYEDKPNTQRLLIRSEFRGAVAKVR
ncbi:MAG: hypothetical protein AAGM45_09140 [Cyanobacteria bacterium J06588_5]